MRIEALISPGEWSEWAILGIGIVVAGANPALIEVTMGPDAHAWCAPRAIAWRDPELVLRADRAPDAPLRAMAAGPGRLALGGLGAITPFHLAPGEILRAHPRAALLATGDCVRLFPEADAPAGWRHYGAGDRPGLLLLTGRGCLFRLVLAAGERILVSEQGLLCATGAIVLEPPVREPSDGLPPLIACHGEGALIVQSGVV